MNFEIDVNNQLLTEFHEEITALIADAIELRTSHKTEKISDSDATYNSWLTPFAFFFFLTAAVLLIIHSYTQNYIFLIMMFLSVLVGFLFTGLHFLIKFITKSKRTKKPSFRINKPHDLSVSFIFDDYSFCKDCSHVKGYYSTSIRGLSSNRGCVYREYLRDATIIFPLFAVKFNLDNVRNSIKLIHGKNLSKEMRFEELFDSDLATKNYPYRKFYRKGWKYEKKNGGPDLRYSNNPTVSYYSYYSMTFFSEIEFPVVSESVYQNAISCLQKPHYLKTQERDTLIIKLIKYNVCKNNRFTEYSQLINYLRIENILYLDTGVEVQFEYDGVAYRVGQNLELIDQKGNVAEILGVKYE